jgi:hypothetical protein
METPSCAKVRTVLEPLLDGRPDDADAALIWDSDFTELLRATWLLSTCQDADLMTRFVEAEETGEPVFATPRMVLEYYAILMFDSVGPWAAHKWPEVCLRPPD